MDAFALALVAVITMLGPMVAVVLLLRRRAERAQQRLDEWRARLAADLGFSLEMNDAIAGTFEGRFVRIVWSLRAGGTPRGGGRPLTYCELPFGRRLGLHLALSTGWPWGGRKRTVPGIRRPISVRCDGPDHEGPLLASIAPIANDMPDHLTFEIDDATVRVFGWGHATDLADLTARLRYAIRLGDAVTGAIAAPKT